ncbi:hypothetical protein, partial [Enterobacter bugandensis]|uniref:hypothetical protein n=1 Tax=Enterobacter bugandensis TaxID=881260 RepID=UPI001954BA54
HAKSSIALAMGSGYPLKCLLGLALRCLVAIYISGFLLIGPTSVSITRSALLGIVIVVSCSSK